MKKYDLSILIPARNEQFLARTVEDILSNIRGKTEIIVVLDGEWADPGLPQHKDLTVIYNPVSVGQRAATNQACRLSKAKYVIKTDAHCAFDEGFDVKLMADMQDDWTIVPLMKNLHAFDWKCKKCDRTWYQGRSPKFCCRDRDGHKKNDACDNTTDFERVMVWKPRRGTTSTCYRFDNTLHFQYFGELGDRQQGDLIETMGLQGSFFMLTRKKYWELDICDEKHGSWGQQGVEVACKTWLSGGKVMVSRKTWYAHMFRTQGGDFGFPYTLLGADVEKARKYSRSLWFENKWPKAKYPLSWLIDRFAPVPGWESMSKGVLYYTDNELEPRIMDLAQKKLLDATKGLDLVSVSLKPISLGRNIVLSLERGYLTMAKQILAGLEELKSEIVFFCEHDVIYHPSHFDFFPARADRYYYNTNVWKVRDTDGHAVRVDDCRQLSGLCANRQTLITHYKERIRRIETEGFSRKMGFEPGTHKRDERVDDLKSEKWESKYPNIDIRHSKNLTSSRWSPEEFRDKRYTLGWKESDEIPGWGKYKDIKS